MQSKTKIDIPREVKLYAFQLKRVYGLKTVEKAYEMIMNQGVKTLQESLPTDFVPHDGRGRKKSKP